MIGNIFFEGRGGFILLAFYFLCDFYYISHSRYNFIIARQFCVENKIEDYQSIREK